jgi:rhomboid protease GluP
VGKVRHFLAKGYFPWATIALLIINVIAWLITATIAALSQKATSVVGFLQHMINDGISPSQAVSFGALYMGKVAEDHSYYRFVTAFFLHQNIIHLAGNMLGLLTYGIILNFLIGGKRFLLVYLTAGIGGAILHAYMQPAIVGFGASGAVNGVLAALSMFVAFGKIPVIRTNYFLRLYQVLYLVYILCMDLKPPITYAHIGGWVIGFLWACILPYHERD